MTEGTGLLRRMKLSLDLLYFIFIISPLALCSIRFHDKLIIKFPQKEMKIFRRKVRKYEIDAVLCYVEFFSLVNEMSHLKGRTDSNFHGRIIIE